MGKLIPVIMLLVGVGIGVGAGIFLKPAPPDVPHDGTTEQVDAHGDAVPADHGAEGDTAGHGAEGNAADQPDSDPVVEYVKMSNQFVVPVVANEKVTALVVLSLSLEVTAGGKEETFQREPKLRSAFNQVLFDHANSGGFDGVFTDASNMIVLEDALYEVAVKIMGDIMRDVLIVDIVRQDY